MISWLDTLKEHNGEKEGMSNGLSTSLAWIAVTVFAWV